MPPSSGNLGFQMTPLPTPAASPTPVETYADQQKQQGGAQMPPVYQGGKAGGLAFLADKLWTGWLAGTKVANQKKQDKMTQEIGAAKTGLDYIGQAYRAAVESGDEKKIAETKGALSEAYKDYLDKSEKYALPEGKDGKAKKPGAKDRLKAAAGMENPHTNVAHSTLDIMRKTDPSQLYGPSKREQQETKVLDMQTKQMEEQQQQHDRWTKIATQDPSKPLSPEDKKFQEFYEYEHFGKTKNDQIKDDLLGKVVSGGKMSDQERQVAENMGLIKPKVTNTTTRTIMGPKGQPQTQLVSIGPDGAVVGTQILPGNEYVPPNQAQMAGQVINAQMGAMMKWGAKAHPEWDQNTPDGKKALTNWALSSVVGGTAGANADWYTKNQQMDVMNRALGAVLQKHTKEYKGPDGTPQTQRDDLASAMMGNIVSTTDDGRYAYMPSLAQGQKEGESSWYKPWTWGSEGTEKWSGMTREQLNDSERRFQAELRAELKKQNPKLGDTEIDKMVPSMLTSQKAGGQQMQPPPSQGSAQAMQPPPGQDGGVRSALAKSALGVQPGPQAPPGEQWYTVRMPDGSTPIRHMSPEYAEALKARGITVQPSGQ